MDKLIDINILEVTDPGNFKGIELPSLGRAASINRFHQMVKEMNEYCNNDQLFFNHNFHPNIGKVVYGGYRLKDKTWHRVVVEDVLQSKAGRQCICYLVDYGQNETIAANKLMKLPEEYLQVPHQVQKYSLHGIQALTLALDSELMSYKSPCVVWDTSASEYLKKLYKRSTNSQVEIIYVNSAGVKYVRLYMNTDSGRICVNDDLVKREYAAVCNLSPNHVYSKSSHNGQSSLPLENFSAKNTEIQDFITLMNQTISHKNHDSQTGRIKKSGSNQTRNHSKKPSADFDLCDSITQISKTRTRQIVTESETMGQTTPDYKIDTPMNQSMEKLLELMKVIPKIESDNICDRAKTTGELDTSDGFDVSSSESDRSFSIPFQRARLPKCALQKTKPSSSSESSSPSKSSLCSSQTSSSSPSKPLKSPNDLRKLIQRLSDSSDSSSSRSLQFSGDEQPMNPRNSILDDLNLIASKSEKHGQLASKRLLQKLMPPSRMFANNTSKDTVKSLPELIHGVKIPEPFMEIENLPFAESVKDYIDDCDFKSMMVVQAYTWPAILKGRHIVGISPPNSGKTIAYLAPLITQLTYPSMYLTLPIGCGPIVVVIVSSWKKAQSVYETCTGMVDGQKDFNILTLYAGGSEDSQTFELLHGCKILIATPNCLLRVLEKGYTNLRRLCHLVLDDAEILTEQFTEQIKVLMQIFGLALKENSELRVPKQILLFSALWTPYVELFVKAYLQKPLIIILSRTEAAVYGKVKQVVHMCHSKQRLSELSKLLESINVRGNKIVIFSSDEQEITEIHKLLSSRSLYGIVARNSMDLDELQEASLSWMRAKAETNAVILISSDECLATLSITDATHVIHYDQPATKTKFGVRLSCLFSYYRNLAENKPQKLVPVSNILVTEKSLESARAMCSIFKRSGAAIPKEFKDLLAGQQAGRDDDEDISFCPYIKAYGICSNQLQCVYRHQVVADIDHGPVQRNTNLPTCGEAKMKVLEVIDASHYYVRLLELRESEEHVKDLTAEYLKLFLDLAQHFSRQSNHKIHRMAKVGDLCALNDKNNQYHRVKILKIFFSKKELTSQKAKVQFYDEGKKKEILCSQLLALPAALKAFPPQAVEVYLCHLRPMDSDTEWTPKANSCAYSLINDVIIDGKIILSLGNTIWVDPLVHRVHLESIQSTINKINIRSELIKNKLATNNPEHARNLIEMFKDKVPVDDSVIKFYTESIECENEEETEILPQGEDYHDVYITAVDHPGLFHVQKIDKNVELEKIQDEITEKIRLDEIKSLMVTPSVGDYCLAPFTAQSNEHRWYRIRVLDVDDEGFVCVLYVDYGDLDTIEYTNLKYLPQKYHGFPHQAIECCLADIKPTGQEWSEESGNCLWNLTRYINKDYKKLVAQVCSKSGNAVRTGRYLYEVKLFDTTCEFDINISEELLWRQHAICDNDQLTDLFSKTNSEVKNLHNVSAISALCSHIYWNQNLDDGCKTEKQLDQIISSNVSNYYKTEMMIHNGGVKSMVRLIGYLSNPTSHAIILSCLTQAILHSPRFCKACCSEDINIQHSITRCLEQVDKPLIQHQAAECMETLLTEKESLREKWNNKSSVRNMCDLLEETTSPQIQCHLCRSLACLLQDSNSASEVISEHSAVNTASSLLVESPNHETQEAAIYFLSTLSRWQSGQKKVKKNNVIDSVMKFMNTSLCKLCLHHGVVTFQYLSQASRKNKTLLLEKEIFHVFKRLMSMNLDSTTKSLCEEMECSLAVRTPQTDLTQPTVTYKPHSHPSNGNLESMPPVKWAQSTYKVIVSVHIHGANPDDFTILEESIHFRANLDDRRYRFDIDLFGEVVPSMSRVSVKGNCTQLSLRKQVKGMWSRLHRQKCKMPSIVVDYDKVVVSSDSEVSDTENAFSLVKAKKAKLPKSGPAHKLKSPFMEDSDTSEDSLVLLSDEERDEEDPYDFFR